MNVKHHLVCGAPIVLEHVVGRRSGGFEDGAGKTRKHAPNGRGSVVREFVQVRLSFFGDHERVSLAQWTDVEEREHVVVLVDSVTRQFAVENSREDGALIGHSGLLTVTLT